MQLKHAVGSRKYPIIALALAVFATTIVAAPAAQAADRQILYVVGTADVYDSNLIQSVIEPGFEAAYPQYDLQYVSLGTTAAINYAKAGTAAAMIVHAASVENQFVAAGFSAEPYGRAVFWGDYVLTGSLDDQAGIAGSASHDIVSSYEKIAAAGAAGNANFVSRSGGPGTTVQEHAIWALTSGVTLCKVSDANGGGMSPSTTTGDCPSTISFPSWYHSASGSQSENINKGNVCNYGQSPAVNNCYVFTDRGTFNYMQSQGQAQKLKVVVRNNDDTARGTSLALVNSFHAYVINPNAPFTNPGNVRTNVPGATAFLDWLTSPAGQTAVHGHLPADPPFIPSAAPKVTASALPASVLNGTPFTVTGNISNVTPGTPALAGKTVTLKAVPTATPTAAGVAVATAVTDAAGNYSITYSPTASQIYAITTDTISQIENSTLSPAFGDLLTATSLPLSTVKTTRNTAKVSISKIKVSKKYSALITIKVSPAVAGTDNVIKVYGRNSKTKSDGLHVVKTIKLKAGQKTVQVRYQLAKDTKHAWKKLTWKLKLKYSGSQITTKTSTTKTVVLR